jgi:hypothetical protein
VSAQDAWEALGLDDIDFEIMKQDLRDVLLGRFLDLLESFDAPAS